MCDIDLVTFVNHSLKKDESWSCLKLPSPLIHVMSAAGTQKKNANRRKNKLLCLPFF